MIHENIKDYKLDIIVLSEVNIHWPLLKPAGYWEDKISVHW